MRFRACLYVLAFLILLALPASAAAQLVGVASGDVHGTLARRLSAELRARGYDVRDLTRETAETPVDLLDAIAWANDEPASVRICVSAALGRAPGCETIEDPDDAVLLLRAVELLRAHLGDAAPRAPAPPVETRDEAPPEPPPSRIDAWSLAFAASLVPPVDTLSTGLGVSAALAWSPDPWLALELGGFASLVDPRVDDASGSASFAARMLWLGADLRVPPELLGGHRVLIGGEVGAAFVEVHARAAPPLEARDQTVVALMLLARAAVVFHLAPRVGLLLGARVGGALPRPAFAFDAREVARWGAPLVTVDLGVVVDFGD